MGPPDGAAASTPASGCPNTEWGAHPRQQPAQQPGSFFPVSRHKETPREPGPGLWRGDGSFPCGKHALGVWHFDLSSVNQWCERRGRGAVPEDGLLSPRPLLSPGAPAEGTSASFPESEQWGVGGVPKDPRSRASVLTGRGALLTVPCPW